MQVINALILNAKKEILLVKKKQTWILPGGKPLKNENDITCLLRELKEELPELKRVRIIKYIVTLDGAKSPHTKKELNVKIYLVKVETGSIIKPAAEINQAIWTAEPENYQLSEMTKKIIVYLRQKQIIN